MKKISVKMKIAIDNAIELPGLSHKLFEKYMNYLQGQVKSTIKESPPLVALSQQKRGV
jgi:hypothetical protein